VVAKRKDGITIMRSTVHFKKVPYHQSDGETERPKPATEINLQEMQVPTLDPVKPPQNRDLTNGVQSIDPEYSPHRGIMNCPSDRSAEPNQPATPTQKGGLSARLRRSACEYLPDKYLDCVLPDKIRCRNISH